MSKEGVIKLSGEDFLTLEDGIKFGRWMANQKFRTCSTCRKDLFHFVTLDSNLFGSSPNNLISAYQHTLQPLIFCIVKIKGNLLEC